MRSIPPLKGNRCLCRLCGQIFSNPRNFDRHRRASACLPPGTAGLVEVGGVWKRPKNSTTAAQARFAALRRLWSDGTNARPPGA